MQESPHRTSPEHIILRTRQHWILVLIPLIGFGILAALVWAFLSSTSATMLFCIRGTVIAVGGVYVARAAIAYATTELILTNKRVVLRAGLLRRRRLEFPLQKVESVDVEQAPLCLLFGCGTLKIVGTGGTVQTLRAAARPFELRDSLHRMVEGLSG